MTANHTIENLRHSDIRDLLGFGTHIWDITIKFAPVLAYINKLNAVNEMTVI
jgi:hypothetical protein